jgi:hypothetical protein
MGFKEFLKRVLPFFLTFAFGLFIASFFVSIVPNFKFEKRNWSRHHQYHQRLEFENQRLREENQMLKRQLDESQKQNLKLEVGKGNVTINVPKAVKGIGTGNGIGSGNGVGNGSGYGNGTTYVEEK